MTWDKSFLFYIGYFTLEESLKDLFYIYKSSYYKYKIFVP